MNKSQNIELPVDRAYEEGCATLRHYSTAVRNIRAITIAQGFVVLSGIAFLSKEDQPILAIIGAIFGIFLTIILGVHHHNYHGNVMAVSNYLVGLEKRYFIEEVALWSKLEKERDNRFSKGPYYFFLNKAVYYLMVSAMLAMVIVNLIIKT